MAVETQDVGEVGARTLVIFNYQKSKRGVIAHRRTLPNGKKDSRRQGHVIRKRYALGVRDAMTCVEKCCQNSD